ncbi:MAG: bacteriohemerythrin [Treponema sp.]|jgi:hemerythrin|nr:bacteriohemerythrin [Treponema sp.]
MINTKSELITWSPTFACGVKVIDDQHKGLINLVNKMFNHVTGDEAEELAYFNIVIKEAVQYIKTHFATEEKIMKATKFDGYIDHKRAHESFILSVVECINDYKEGKKYTLATFTKFLKEWILSHVAVMDKQYFEHFKKMITTINKVVM